MAARARRSRSIALALALLRRGLEADRETLLSLVGRWALPSGGAFRAGRSTSRRVWHAARLAPASGWYGPTTCWSSGAAGTSGGWGGKGR